MKIKRQFEVGIQIGDKVRPLKRQLSVELGPGLIGGIFDGVQRRVEVINQYFKYFESFN